MYFYSVEHRSATIPQKSTLTLINPAIMTSSPPVNPCQTPVLFLVFNRPSTTRRVFEAIRAAKPSKLYIAADGPRYHKKGEAEKCLEVRTIVLDVDWECEV